MATSLFEFMMLDSMKVDVRDTIPSSFIAPTRQNQFNISCCPQSSRSASVTADHVS